MRERLSRWYGAHPYSLCWFSIAFCACWLAWGLYTRWWLAAFGMTVAGAFNGWVIWRGKQRDAAAMEMERLWLEAQHRKRADRDLSHRRNPEEP